MKKILIISSYSPSLIKFRGKLIDALQANNMEVHVAAPDLVNNRHIKAQLESNDVISHDLKLSRNGLNPFLDLITFFQLIKLMKIIFLHTSHLRLMRISVLALKVS